MKINRQIVGVLLLSWLCVIATPATAFFNLGNDEENTNDTGVSIGDSNSRTHLEAELTISDLMAFAENVTNKMLASPSVAKWSKKKPKLVLGSLINNTDNPNLRVNDMYDRIVEVVLNANIARIVDVSATSFDYIVKSEISSNRQYGAEGRQMVEYVMTFKMFTIEGELKGQWSDRLKLLKKKRSSW